MTILDFVILCLAAWRLAHLLVKEDGPWRMFAKLRKAAGVQSVTTITAEQGVQTGYIAYGALAEGLLCIWCVSVWCAAFIVLGSLAPVIGICFTWLTRILAVSAGAILVQETLTRLRGVD